MRKSTPLRSVRGLRGKIEYAATPVRFPDLKPDLM